MKRLCTFGRISILLVMLLLAAACGSGSSGGGTTSSTTNNGKGVQTTSSSVTIQHAQGNQYPPGPIDQQAADDHHPNLPPVPSSPVSNPRPATAIPPATSITSASGSLAARAAPALRPAYTVTFNVNSSLHAALATSNSVSGTGEISEGSNGSDALITGNWFAAYTTNNGSSFNVLNPYTMFPSADGGFCCDQIAHFTPVDDGGRFLWLLQYCATNACKTGTNRLRLAWNSTGNFESSGATDWWYIDLPTTQFGLNNQWFDYPDVAIGDHALYITSDVVGDGGNKNIIFRIGLDQLILSGGTVGFNYWVQTDIRNAPWRVAQNTGTTAFFAHHKDNAHLRIYTWDESSNLIYPHDIGIYSWTSGPYSSVQPGSVDWMTKLNGFPGGAVEGATRSGDSVWFAWSAAKDSNFPQPYIDMAVISASSLAVTSQPALWWHDYAYAYPALATNGRGAIGISYEWGGGSVYNNHAVGILTGPYYLVDTTGSNIGVTRFGDYVTIRRHYGGEAQGDISFSASGYGMVKDSNGNVYDDPHYIIFTPT
jgi:hypothetical protein